MTIVVIHVQTSEHYKLKKIVPINPIKCKQKTYRIPFKFLLKKSNIDSKIFRTAPKESIKSSFRQST